MVTLPPEAPERPEAPEPAAPPAAAGKRTFHYVLDSETNQISSYTEKVNGRVVLAKRPEETDGREYKFWRLWESSQLKLARQEEDLKTFAQIRQLCKSTAAKGKAARQQGAAGGSGARARARGRSSWCRRRRARRAAPSRPPPPCPPTTASHPRRRPCAARCPTSARAGAGALRARLRRGDRRQARERVLHACGGQGRLAVRRRLPARRARRTSGRGQATPDEEDSYYCDESKAMVMRENIKERMADGTLQPVNEQELLELLRTGTTAVERSAWGSYDEQIILHFSLEFAPHEDTGHTHEQDLRINPATHFRKALTPARLLVPHESEVYRAGSYEIPVVNGVAACSAKLNRGVTTPNLVEMHKHQPFEWVARCLHPSLRGLPEFTVRSLPVRTKAVLTNEVNPNERFVRMPDGTIVPSPPEDCPSATGAEGRPLAAILRGVCLA